MNESGHYVDRWVHHHFELAEIYPYIIYVPMARILGPKTSPFSIIFFTDLSSVESSSPRSPSAVPDDCIIRCIDRRVCFKAAARATEILPGRYIVGLIASRMDMKKVAYHELQQHLKLAYRCPILQDPHRPRATTKNSQGQTGITVKAGKLTCILSTKTSTPRPLQKSWNALV